MAFGAVTTASGMSLGARSAGSRRGSNCIGYGLGCFVWCWYRLIGHRVSFHFEENRLANCRLLAGRRNLLWSRRWSRLLTRAAAGPALSMLHQFLLALQFLIETNRLVLDDDVGNFQAPLELLDDIARGTANDHVNKEALTVFRHAIGQPARAPLLGF